MVRPKSHPKVFEAQRAASSWDTASPARGGSKAFTACATTHRSAEPERCWRLPHGVETRAPGVPGEVLQPSRYRTAMAAYWGNRSSRSITLCEKVFRCRWWRSAQRTWSWPPRSPRDGNRYSSCRSGPSRCRARHCKPATPSATRPWATSRSTPGPALAMGENVKPLRQFVKPALAL